MSKGRIWVGSIILSIGAMLSVYSLYSIFVFKDAFKFSLFLSGGIVLAFVSFILYSSILVGAELKLAAVFLNKINRLSKTTYEENNERLNEALNTIREVYPAKKQIILSLLTIESVFLCLIIVFSTIYYIWVLFGLSIVTLVILTVFLSLKLKFLNQCDLDYRSLMKLSEEKDGTIEKKNSLTKLEIVGIPLGEHVVNKVYELNTVNTIVCSSLEEKKHIIDILMLVKFPQEGQVYFDGKNASQIISRDRFKYVAIINEKNLKFNFEGDNNITLFNSFSSQMVERVRDEVEAAFKGKHIKTISFDSLTRSILKDATIYVIDGDFSLNPKEANLQLKAILELLPDKMVFVVKTEKCKP